MEARKKNDAPKRLFNKQKGSGTLPGIAVRISLIFGVILFSLGLYREGGPLTASYRDDTVYVEASYGKEARIPKEAELRASLMTPEENPDIYSQDMAAAMAAAGRDDETVSANAIYKVGFYVGDQEVEPEAPVNVTLQALKDGFAAGEPIKVVHLVENDAEVIADTSVDDAGSVSFTTDGFSNFAFVPESEEGVSNENIIKTAAKESDAGGSSVFVVTSLQPGEGVSDWDTIKDKAKTGGSVHLTTNITATSPCAVTGDLIIDLNGYTIKSSGINSSSHASNGIQGYVMAVDGSLTIMDSSNGNGKFTVNDGNPFGLVYVRTGGTLTLNGGIFENSKGFHAFRVAGGRLIMEGGTIQNSGKENTDQGGGISVASGDLAITGGTIKNNKANTGAGIQFEGGGNFTMTGGTITGNTAGSNGGGLYFTGCSGNISITGGTISGNTTGTKSHGGGLWINSCSNITIGGTTKITDNKASAGGGIRVEDSTMTINETAEISNNIAESQAGSTGSNGIGGGIAAYQSQITIDGGKISGNKAEFGGGGIALRQGGGNYEKNRVTLMSGVISDNEVTGGEWQYGGGVYLQDHTSFTMTGGTISGNHGEGQGGGIATDYSGVDGECTGDMVVTINGGTISGNYSTLHEGGGIGMGSGTLVIEAKNGQKVYIENNESRTTEHWGGGGIMISDKSQAVIVNALIADNSADGFGGGLGACSTGHVYYGVGVYEDNPSPLAAIFGNTAQGKNMSGYDSKKHADWDAYKNEVFMRSGYQDVYSALEAVISGLMLGGGDEAWTGSADGAPVAVGKDGFVSASQMLGLTSHASAEDQAKARAAASVFITDNHSNTHGGGIMCNGSLAMGWTAKMDVTPGLAIKGTKQYEVNKMSADAVPEFQFAISNKEPVWVNDTEGEETGGHWQAKDDSGVFTTKNSVDGNFAFDLTFGETQPCLTKETGEQTFYFWEVNEGGNNVTYDPSLYRVTVIVSESTTTQGVAGATLSINTWSIKNESATVGKWDSETKTYIPVSITQKVEENNNSEEAMHWTTRTVITLNGGAFKNTYDGDTKLSIKKIDENGDPLQGAKFTLYQKDETGGNIIYDWEDKWIKKGEYTSAEDGVIYKDDKPVGEKLPVGTYRLVETEVPEGYKLLPGYIEFEIKGTDFHRMISCPYNPMFSEYVEVTDNGLILQIKNTLVRSSLRIIKVDEASLERAEVSGEAEKVLSGAEFELYSTTKSGDDGNLVRDKRLWTALSQEDGRLFWTKDDASKEGSFDLTLTAGTYYLYETKAPAGFLQLEKPITITVANNGEVTWQSEEVKLQKKDGETVLTFWLPNTGSYTLPETGGPGTLFYLLTGFVLVLGSAAVLSVRGRSRRA